MRTHPSLLLTGSSGTGKSYGLKWLIRNLLEHYTISLFFCNFKRSEDFRFLKGYKHYYTFLDCKTGLEDFYQRFKAAQARDIEFDGTYCVLVFDEYPAFFISIQDKKEVERLKAMISEILILGRGYGFALYLVMQRPDSAFLSNGARDNFMSTISLGNLSKEAKTMLYSGEDLPDRIYQVGEGVCWIDGRGMTEIKFPIIQDVAGVEKQILDCLGMDGQSEVKY